MGNFRERTGEMGKLIGCIRASGVPIIGLLLLSLMFSAQEVLAGKDADKAHSEIYAESIYPSAKTCAACHPKQYSEWAVSQHAYAQLSPIYMAMQMRINTITSGTNGDFCIRCHNQIGMNFNEPIELSNLKRPASSREGITCSVCHRVNKSYGKISGRLPLVRGPMHSIVFGPSAKDGQEEVDYVLNDPDKKGFRVVADPKDRGLMIHKKSDTFFELTQPGFCGTCHDVTLLNGFRLEEAFSEYKQTSSAKNEESCQDCHMATVPGQVSKYEVGPAAVVNGIPTRKRRLSNHFFAGPDYSLIHPGLFPHNPKAAEFAELEDWLAFDWKAGWGTEEFEEYAEEPGDAIAFIKIALEDAKKEPEALQEMAASFEELMELLGEDVVTKNKSAFESLVAYSESFEDVETLGDKEVETLKNLKGELEALATKLGLNFPDTWADSGDRMEAREILDDNLERLKWAETERYKIMRHGYQLGDLQTVANNSNGLKFSIPVRNGTNGHGVPTGFDAERLVFLQVTVRDSKGNAVYKSGDRDPNGDVRDRHSLYVHNGELPPDDDLFNLQTKFIVRMARGGEREQVLAVNTSTSALPFVRPETRATILYGRPLGARKHKKTIEPLGVKNPSYAVPAGKLREGETYSVNVKLIAQMIPVHLIPAIQESGFDYGMTPRELAENVVEGAMMLHERDMTVTYNPNGKKREANAGTQPKVQQTADKTR